MTEGVFSALVGYAEGRAKKRELQVFAERSWRARQSAKVVKGIRENAVRERKGKAIGKKADASRKRRWFTAYRVAFKKLVRYERGLEGLKKSYERAVGRRLLGRIKKKQLVWRLMKKVCEVMRETRLRRGVQKMKEVC